MHAVTWTPGAKVLRWLMHFPEFPCPGRQCGNVRVSAASVDYISQKAKGERPRVLTLFQRRGLTLLGDAPRFPAEPVGTR